ncbi:MAG: GntR family transcriptional regulator [Polyangiaceae bacterium]
MPKASSQNSAAKSTRTTPAAAAPPAEVGLSPVARLSVVDAVAEQIQGEILRGRMPAGSRLPPERELAVTLGVNRLTLRAALSRLEALGLIATRHGAGTLVTHWRERAGLEALASLLNALTPDEDAWVELVVSLLEVRRVLVAEALALAAERHTPEDIANLRALAAEQAKRVDDVLAYARGELVFQRAIVRAGGNVGLELILNTLARLPDEQPKLVARLYESRDPALYSAVIDLIAAGDGNAAREMIRGALALLDEQWLAKQGFGAFASGGAKQKGAPKKPVKKKGST